MPYERLPSASSCAPVRPDRAGVGLTLLVVGWGLLALLLCWALVVDAFKRDALPPGELVAHWPAESKLPKGQDRPTLLVFLHPKCPCSKATLAELARIWVLANEPSQSSPRLVIDVPVPRGEPSDWLSTSTVEQAKQLPDATVVFDPDGEEAARFGATTSGTVMWFDPAGRCLYAGGITFGRGHEGANTGRDSVEQLMRGEAPAETHLPAFGCRLCLPNED